MSPINTASVEDSAMRSTLLPKLISGKLQFRDAERFLKDAL